MITKKIGIDLGTVNTLICLPKQGIVINEPTVVALSNDDDKVVAIGKEALGLVGRTPENLTAYQPLKDGVISDFHVTQVMLRHYLTEAIGRFLLVKPEVMISIPAGATSTEKKAVLDATMAAGAKNAYLIQEPLAAALGATLPINGASGQMVIDIGGGTTEIAILSLGGVVAQASVRTGGNKIDQAILEYIRRHYGVIIGEQSAEDIKISIGTALRTRKELTKAVKGRDIVGGLPKSVKISSYELVEVIQEVIDAIIRAIRAVLEDTPPELISDIIDTGIVLTGGGACLKEIDSLFSKIMNVPVIIAEEPMLCVAKGTVVALKNLRDYQKSVLAYA